MTPHPGGESLVSKILYMGIILILLLIIGACAIFIYGYVNPAGDPTPVGTPVPVVTQMSTPVPTPVPSVVSVAPTKSISTGNYQRDTKVTGGQSTQDNYYYPGIWDHYIVYDMFDGTKNYTILYDTNTMKEQVLDSGTVFSYGAISNGKVVLYYPLKGDKIYLYNIQTGTPSLTSNDDNRPRGSITMFDTMLAYYQDLGHADIDGNWEPFYAIFVFKMNLNERYDVIDNIPKPLDLRMYGQKLVYTVVDPQGGSDVFLLDLSSQDRTPQKISTGTGNNNHARIYENHIVYHSDASGTEHINIYDIGTGKTFSPTTKGEQWNAEIYGNTVVYDDNRNGNWDIYAYDLGNNTERQITSEPHDQQDPVIYGNRIAYLDDRNGYQAIYTMTI